MRRHAYRIMAVALYALPGVVVVAAVGAIYWISLVMKMRHLLGSREAASAGATSNTAARVARQGSDAMMFARVDAKEALLETVFE